MSPADREILAAIAAHPRPAERKRVAALLGVDDDAELAATLARLVRGGLLDRFAVPAPGDKVMYCYSAPRSAALPAGTIDPAPAPPPGVVDTAPARADPGVADAASPAPPASSPPQEPPAMGIHANSRREKIVASIALHPRSTAADIAARFHLTPDQAAQELWALAKIGRISANGKGRPKTYTVAAAGHAEARNAEKPAAKRRSAARRGRVSRRPKDDTLIAPAPKPAQPGGEQPFRVALTSDDTLVMERPHTRERVELQGHEIAVLTAFLRKLDSLSPLP